MKLVLTKLFNKWWPVARPVSISPIEFRCSARPGAVTTGCTQMEVGCRPSGQGWELIGFFVMAEWCFSCVCFSSDSTYPWHENHQKKKQIWGNIFWATCSEHPRSKSRLEMFETWPGGQQLNLLNIMLFFFHRAMCYKRVHLLKRSKISPSKFEGGKMMMFIHVYPFVAGWCFHSFPEWSSVFLVNVTSNSILEPGV